MKPDEVQCPYDKTHIVLKTRLPIHLEKCRKNHPETKMLICPFNVTHYLPSSDMGLHVETCVDRATFENFRYVDEPTTSTGSAGATGHSQHVPVQCEENWDEEDEPTYDAKKYMESAPVLVCKKGGTKTEKKQFREAEHRRHIKLKKKEEEKKEKKKD